MFKKFLFVLAVSCSLTAAGCGSGGSKEVTEGNLTFKLLSDGTYSVSGYVEPFENGHCDIPETVNDVPVTRIRSSAFYGCTSLRTISIPTTINSIFDAAFRGCASLQYVILPNSVTTIRDQAFCNCTALSSIFIPDSITTFGNDVFLGCDNLQYNEFDNAYYLGNAGNPNLILMEKKDYEIPSCTISDKCKIIADSAFNSCHLLTSIKVPDSVISINWSAFSSCDSLASIDLGKNVAVVADHAFYDCRSLSSIFIPSGVRTIGNDAFYGCCSLIEINVENSNPYYSSIDGVLYDKNLQEIVKYPEGKNSSTYSMPNTVTSIADSAFSRSQSLVTVNIPEGVKTIGIYAFLNCHSLISILIPKSVTTIGWNAFASCDSLTIYCRAGSKPSGWDDDWNPDNRPVAWGYQG